MPICDHQKHKYSTVKRARCDFDYVIEVSPSMKKAQGMTTCSARPPILVRPVDLPRRGWFLFNLSKTRESSPDAALSFSLPQTSNVEQAWEVASCSKINKLQTPDTDDGQVASAIGPLSLTLGLAPKPRCYEKQPCLSNSSHDHRLVVSSPGKLHEPPPLRPPPVPAWFGCCVEP